MDRCVSCLHSRFFAVHAADSFGLPLSQFLPFLCRERCCRKPASNASVYTLAENRPAPAFAGPDVFLLVGVFPNPPRRRKLHIPRFRQKPKARSFRCSSFPHATRFVGLARGPRSRLRRGCAISAKSLFGQLTAAPKDVPFEHFSPGHPYPKCGQCWPWLSAAPSIPRGPGDSRRMPLSSPQAAQRTRRSAP